MTERAARGRASRSRPAVAGRDASASTPNADLAEPEHGSPAAWAAFAQRVRRARPPTACGAARPQPGPGTRVTQPMAGPVLRDDPDLSRPRGAGGRARPCDRRPTRAAARPGELAALDRWPAGTSRSAPISPAISTRPALRSRFQRAPWSSPCPEHRRGRAAADLATPAACSAARRRLRHGRARARARPRPRAARPDPARAPAASRGGARRRGCRSSAALRAHDLDARAALPARYRGQVGRGRPRPAAAAQGARPRRRDRVCNRCARGLDADCSPLASAPLSSTEAAAEPERRAAARLCDQLERRLRLPGDRARVESSSGSSAGPSATRWRRDLSTRAFGGSRSPALYLPFFPAALDAFLGELVDAGLPSLGLPLRGLTVVSPHKEEALAIADSATERARRAGAANLLVRAKARWQGRERPRAWSRRSRAAGIRPAVARPPPSSAAAELGERLRRS